MKYFINVSAFPPLKMNLILAGHVLSAHATKQGYYYLEKEKSNGFPYWKQQNGSHAIWFQKSWYNGWTIGDIDSLGQDYDGIIGPHDVSKWPMLIPEGFKFWNVSNWQSATKSDLAFEDCK